MSFVFDIEDELVTWLIFCQLDTNLSNLGGETSIEESPSADWPVSVSVKHIRE